MLIEAGANVSLRRQDGWTNLHYASMCGHVNIIRRLCAEGADINAQNPSGETPLHWAIDRKEIHAVKELLRLGAKTNIASNGRCRGKRTALDWAMGRDSDIVSLLQQWSRREKWRKQISNLYYTSLITYRTSSNTMLDSMDIEGTREMLFQLL